MMHMIKLIERRHPDYVDRVVSALCALCASAVLLGVGYLLLG